jgi:selenocysteine lyase/cysteine desulfurase
VLQETNRFDVHMAFAAALFSAFVVAFPLNAQGLKNEQAIDTIIGSPVEEEEEQARADPAKLVAAIERTLETTSTVRKTSNVDKVEIVFLPDMAEGAPAEIAAALEKHKDEIASLRQELEGNALLYHAIDSRGVQLKDVVGAEFDGKNAIIYAAAKPANG